MRLWIGGYGADQGGTAVGIGELLAGDADAGSAGGALAFAGTAAEIGGSPTWLAAHPSLAVVYAALEGAGAVQAFRRTGDSSFARLGPAVRIGESVCHVAVSPDATYLLATCWGDGRVVRVALDAVGRPGAATIAASAIDPYVPSDPFAPPVDPGSTATDGAFDLPGGGIDLADAARALREAAGPEFAHLVPDLSAPEDSLAALGLSAGGLELPRRASGEGDGSDAASDTRSVAAPERVSRAHQSVFLGGGLIATTDLGFDLVRFWRSGADGLRLVGVVRLPLGSGPRHMVRHPSGHLYVLTELSCEIFVLGPDRAGAWRVLGGTPLSPETRAGVDAAAELAASTDGQFIYASIRGLDTIASVRVRGAGDDLVPVALADAGVTWPRHHLVVRDTLLVAGQHSNDVVALTLDIRNGGLSRPVRRTEAPSPTCLLPAR
ncbi:beta-propeller fold lactonase family protein [Microbacterium sp. cx-59]|uniref:lactonase family protein n=1 Tax=Microbacterium sp. cx-59 TaxID=2891207 RepID=UPI001E5A035A|nr:beta-propeller fold lactonase family protein [Microbacterium sp. cx-59]MCC4908631.1 lactonase family protein [Microbacterium sp. cx-59]